MIKSKAYKNKGVVIIEFIIFFPVFLLLLFFLIWLGNYIHAKSSLYSAVSRGVALAKTRGSLNTMNFSFDSENKGSLSYIDNFIDNGNFSPRLNNLLGSKKALKKSIIVSNKYNSFLTNSECVERKDRKGNMYNACFYPKANLRELPREALYALVFIANELKLTLGNSTTIPCSPGSEEEIIGGTSEELGCVRCNFMPLAEMGLADCRNNSCEDILNDSGIPIDRFGIECFYRLPNPFINNLFEAIGIEDFGLGVLISAKQWVFRNVSEFCLRNPSLAECNLK